MAWMSAEHEWGETRRGRFSLLGGVSGVHRSSRRGRMDSLTLSMVLDATFLLERAKKEASLVEAKDGMMMVEGRVRGMCGSRERYESKKW